MKTKKKLYLALTILAILALQGITPALSYSPEENNLKNNALDARTSTQTLTLQLEELLLAQNDASEKFAAISSLMANKGTDIKALETEIIIRDLQMQDLNKFIADLMRELYMQTEENSASSRDLKALIKIGNDLLKQFSEHKDSLENEKKGLEKEKDGILKMKDKALETQKQTAFLVEAIKNLLAQTRASEQIYQQLLVQSRKEMKESETASLEYYVQKNDIDKILKEAFADYESTETALRWPVKALLGISAYFHDEGYSSRFGMTHNAIDIPVNQGTEIHAAASGVVLKTQDNGLGYNYITLAHPGEILTTYGHVFKILVREGDIVNASDVIGLSGGIPGTPGAGYVTTGAHLHFEVRVKGEYQDPLEYLESST